MPPLVSLTLGTTPSLSHAATTTTLLPPRLRTFPRPPPRRISAIASVPTKSRAPDPALPANVASQMEVIKSLEGWASDNMLPFLKPVEDSWQPQDFLPDSSKPDVFRAEVQALQERTAEIPDDYLVALVGDMITEDALPTYMSVVNMTYGFQPESAADPNPWATWTRRWTAEENRHGDLLHTYLYLTGRVDMTKIQRTIQHLIGAGMKPHGVAGVQKHPYSMPIYTSFQERATAVSHGNTARLAKQHGDPVLARICGVIAADEKRHENAYVGLVGKLLEVDPSGAMVAIGGWMRNKITMPAQLMYDGEDPGIFQHFSAVAQRIGVYTARDYADITEHLVGKWKLEKLEGLTAEGKEEQEFVCGLAARIRRLQEKVEERAKKRKPHEVRFSWIFNRELSL